jgi:protein SCO1/2
MIGKSTFCNFYLLGLFLPLFSLAGERSLVRFDQEIGAHLPAQVAVIDEQGQLIHLEDIMGKRPSILSFVYYGCPNLCTLVLNGLTEAVRSSGLQPGQDFNVLSLSIDPKEKPALALAKKRTYLARLGQTGDENPSWHFLTAPQTSIDFLTRWAGFHYQYDSINQEFNHPSGIIILTPDGVISRYFFGIRFEPDALREAIGEASQGKFHRTLKEIILNCFHYNPTSGKYGNLIIKILQAVSFVSLMALLALLIRLSLPPKRPVHE